MLRNRNLTRRLAVTISATLLGGVVACSDAPGGLSVTLLDNPAPPGALLPNTAATSDGVLMSWVIKSGATGRSEHGSVGKPSQNDPGHSLQVARYNRTSGWSAASTVSRGENWFINWADFPSVYAIDEHRLAAHWLRRSGEAAYAYDVATGQSLDGRNWSAPWIPHLDGTRTEHGFASFFSIRNQPALVWLDGRNTSPSIGGHSAHAGDGAADESSMSLRARVLPRDPFENRAHEDSTLLDSRVCDCCQTTAVNTSDGAVVLYRDRSTDEIRDIAYVRFNERTGAWSEPAVLHRDAWQINGCPVNGPQADAKGNRVAVAWFTASPSPRVLMAMSNDGGVSFGQPVVVSEVNPLGRVSLSLPDSEHVLVSWVEQPVAQPDSAILAVQLFNDGLEAVARTEVATVSAERRSGFARMARIDDGSALIAWTGRDGQESHVRTARIDIP